MNFNEWYNQPLIRNNFDKTEAYNVWQACKKEVLKILNENKFNIKFTNVNGDELNPKVIKKIENL